MQAACSEDAQRFALEKAIGTYPDTRVSRHNAALKMHATLPSCKNTDILSPYQTATEMNARRQNRDRVDNTDRDPNISQAIQNHAELHR